MSLEPGNADVVAVVSRTQPPTYKKKKYTLCGCIGQTSDQGTPEKQANKWSKRKIHQYETTATSTWRRGVGAKPTQGAAEPGDWHRRLRRWRSRCSGLKQRSLATRCNAMRRRGVSVGYYSRSDGEAVNRRRGISSGGS
ncbi:hypothetical protein E2562_034137 [Oryza meyeriana var. granulata]|uniref:Uncharacterized protein n=1 Tax=Oryza meyeriana var. granulata TaxID=110450 RepID=A0A6G1E683_9ORYZ|nr:hypothetical protein E2562_034137 [Oryza meyeriana var. granulata]